MMGESGGGTSIFSTVAFPKRVRGLKTFARYYTPKFLKAQASLHTTPLHPFVALSVQERTVTGGCHDAIPVFDYSNFNPTTLAQPSFLESVIVFILIVLRPRLNSSMT